MTSRRNQVGRPTGPEAPGRQMAATEDRAACRARKPLALRRRARCSQQRREPQLSQPPPPRPTPTRIPTVPWTTRGKGYRTMVNQRLVGRLAASINGLACHYPIFASTSGSKPTSHAGRRRAAPGATCSPQRHRAMLRPSHLKPKTHPWPLKSFVARRRSPAAPGASSPRSAAS